ncbi:MAG: glycogen debranching protein GlgX [Proteobacteria bacterium]|nr:glycogen debranching protein GlgX [Pseudomonadota bacterium]
MQFRTHVGRPYPLGATVMADGINFAIFSRHGTAVYLELFDSVDAHAPSATIRLDPRFNRTGDVWHVFATNLRGGQLYGYRVDGPYAPVEAGHRFNVHKLLTDPYARALVGEYGVEHDALYGYDRSSPQRDLSFNAQDSTRHTVKSIAIANQPYDWESDQPPRVPLDDSVFYETHVRGFTLHPSSGVEHRGTYLGLIEKIPHLKRLGVTAVELLPVHEFNMREPAGTDPVTQRTITNYWGYSTLGFFSPEQDYASSRGTNAVGEVVEFKEMVKHLHRAGIEVILDVVFNHTGEGNQLGPTLSFRGLDNAVYYMLHKGRHYKNYSGCGNTVNCNHPVVKQFILDCLRYWVVEMHVDGFRFDLATILGRGRQGQWIGELSLLYDIGGDPILRGSKLIAEAWDAEGMYKVGGFPEGWAEWNGRYRDDVRRFLRGDEGVVADLARRLGGSQDLFGTKSSPSHSINFITCHDGFTLRDLVSYEQKHNERNGEGNRDGTDHNLSRNWGAEGETSDPGVRAVRLRQAKNAMALLLFSRGTPMLLGGDELWRTQQGNNNTYCQDNELSWLDWSNKSEAQEFERFVRLVVALRQRHPALRRPCFVDPFGPPRHQGGGFAAHDIIWHGVHLGQPDWSQHSHALALQVRGQPPTSAPHSRDDELYIAFNQWTEPLDFELPPLRQAPWRRVLDTGRPSPEDIVEEAHAPQVTGDRYRLAARAVLLLIAALPMTEPPAAP